MLDIETIEVLLQLRNFVILNLIFFIKNAQKEEIPKELNNLNINKATQNTDIPTKIIKENPDTFGDFIFSNLNCCINTSSYPSLLKSADCPLKRAPVHKKDPKSAKKNYRPTVAFFCHEKFHSFIRFVQKNFQNLTFYKQQNCK